jgi:cytosine deaminase
MDPWYGLGSGDMLEVAHMGLHVAQMTGQQAMHQCFLAVTETPARILGLEGYGIEPGCHADLVLLDAASTVEAIRLRAARRVVIRRGAVVSESPRALAKLSLPGRPAHTGFRLERTR